MASPTPSPGLSTAWCGDRFRRLANPFESLAKRKGPPQRRWSFSMPATAGSAGSRRRVDARFTLAAWTLAFGPLAVWTLVPSDTCHHRLWSLSALVTAARDGARTTQSTERTNSRVNSRFLHDMRWLPECAPPTSGGDMAHRSISIVALVLASLPAVVSAQLDCKSVPAGPELTDCYIALGQYYRGQSDLAAAKARAQSDAAWYRAIVGTDPAKDRPRHRK
jgi:hypothetical protein